MSDKGRPLPKFGEWDVNDPASAEGFTVIFNKARDEKKTGGNARGNNSPAQTDAFKQGGYGSKPNAKKWFCCLPSSTVLKPKSTTEKSFKAGSLCSEIL